MCKNICSTFDYIAKVTVVGKFLQDLLLFFSKKNCFCECYELLAMEPAVFISCEYIVHS